MQLRVVLAAASSERKLSFVDNLTSWLQIVYDDDGFFLAYEDFRESFNDTFPTCAFLFFFSGDQLSYTNFFSEDQLSYTNSTYEARISPQWLS